MFFTTHLKYNKTTVDPLLSRPHLSGSNPNHPATTYVTFIYVAITKLTRRVLANAKKKLFIEGSGRGVCSINQHLSICGSECSCSWLPLSYDSFTASSSLPMYIQLAECYTSLWLYILCAQSLYELQHGLIEPTSHIRTFNMSEQGSVP